MATGRYNSVTALLEVQPEFKIKESSKQYVRDALLGIDLNPAQGTEGPKLSEDRDCGGCAVWTGKLMLSSPLVLR